MKASKKLDALAALHLRKVPFTHWIRRFVGLTDGLDAVTKRNIYTTARIKLIHPA
jgi:hypothetical protein